MLAEQGAIQSTRGAALEYAPPMRSTSLLVPAFLLLVGACQDPEPEENLPGEFGEPCLEGSIEDSPDGCVSGLDCYKGYCEELCTSDADCRAVDGWTHECVVGLCQIVCDAQDQCPQDLGTELTCGTVGDTKWCEAKSET